MGKDDCTVCTKRVEDDQEALCCDTCSGWYHRGCLGLNKTEFKKLERSNQQWFCPKCKANPNDHSNANNKKETYTIGDVMTKLLEMEGEYNKLFKKYEEQLKVNNEMRDELKSIKNKLNVKEQEEINNNVIIKGIPYKRNENLQTIIDRITTALNITTKPQKALRLGNVQNEGKNSTLKLIFKDSDEKKVWMDAKRTTKLSTANILQNCSEIEPVYINHELTKQNFELFKKAKQFKKDHGYKYLWVNSGKILMRKSDTSKILAIKTEDDLKN